ncbi:hypothetical protein OG225_24025 [Nocardia sp. NBC_01377]|uniref:hypothetical protein n=1 Tax=Nocardia sp. NBC_01377 TaxID=2903595 RepID=UPI00325353B0
MRFLGGLFGSNRKVFVEQAVDMLRAMNSVASVESDAEALQISYWTHDGMHGRIDLTTVYRRCRRASAADAGRMLAEFMSISPQNGRADRSGGAERISGWAEIAPLLRPVVRQAGGLDQRFDGERIADHTVWRPVLPYLTETIVIDRPTSMESVNPQHLAEWGVDADTAFATARTNLAASAFDTLAAYDPGSKAGMLHIPDMSGDLYAGSLPLVDGWLSGIGAKAGARPIVFIAQNVGVLIGVEFSEEHVVRLVEMARRLYDDAVRPVSPMPYTVDEAGRLVPYLVARDHRAWREITAAESTLAAQVYGSQYEHLRADLDDYLTEDRAAQLMHVRRPDGVESTIAPWTNTVATLLPRVHMVTLTDVDTGETFGVGWEALAAEVDLRPVPGVYPPRYRVEYHPDAEAMARLRAVAALR